jgi:hypothetical protein
MLINVTLNARDPLPLDPEEALGSIMITDETASEIRQENIWVDDWLAALVNGVEALGRGEGKFSAEVESESKPIVFESDGESFSLSFADNIARGSLPEFRRDLKTAVREMLAAFNADVSLRPDSFWAKLREFAT